MSHDFPASSIRNAALLYGGMTVLAIVASLPLPGRLSALALPDAPSAWLWGLLAGGALLVLTVVTERFWPRFQTLGDTMAAMLGPISAGRALVLAVLSGIGEEALFRGPVQVAAGPVVATLVFAGLHGLGNRRLWPWPIFAALAGCIFAALAWHFHSPWPGAVAHAVVNAVNLRRLGERYERGVNAGIHA